MTEVEGLAVEGRPPVCVGWGVVRPLHSPFCQGEWCRESRGQPLRLRSGTSLWVEGGGLSSGARLLGFESQCLCLLAKGPWVSCLASLCLGLFMYKMGLC